MPHRSSPTLVIGGGLAGLATAAYLARAGRAVRLLERTDQLGGRAATRLVSGFHFNLGPQALYARGHARRVFAELGVAVEGRMPSQRGLVALDNGRRHLLPTGPGALLRTRLLGWRDKLETLRFLAGLPRVEAKRFEELTMKQWLERHITGVQVRALVSALIRLTTYTHAPELLGAAAAIRQLQLAVAGNVLYIDDGWQSLVAGLRQSATAAGAIIETASPFVQLVGDTRITGVALKDGRRIDATAVVLAIGPAEAIRLVGERRPAFARSVRPVLASCLDVGLSHLPNPSTIFALGIDEPLYCSVHSAAARLAPEGGAMIQCVRYGGPEEEIDGRSTLARLETLLDEVQPGWREVVVEARYLSKMTVSHAIVPPGGRTVRVDALATENVFLAGDWVGEEGMLADGALASARRVASLLGCVALPAAA